MVEANTLPSTPPTCLCVSSLAAISICCFDDLAWSLWRLLRLRRAADVLLLMDWCQCNARVLAHHHLGFICVCRLGYYS